MKKFVYFLSFSLLMILSAVAQNNRVDGLRPDAPELAKLGSYAIGVRTLHLSHKNQIDVLNIKEGEALPYYDRPLTVEIWYPADTEQHGGQYDGVYLRDGKTKVTLYGPAVRDAPPLISAKPYPLIVVSHGYPGNRFLMSHFGENLATKGYVVVAIDHTDSNYQDAGAFPSTLLNRPLDQKFILDEMTRFNHQKGQFLENMVDATQAGLIGYSMGGYGAVITAGAGVSEQIAATKEVSPNGILKRFKLGSEEYASVLDDRFKAIIAIGPWGMERGFWNLQNLAAISKPIFFMAGSLDKTSGYENGVKAIYKNAIHINRYLLTFENAAHNAAAPIPAPLESVNAFYPDGSSAFSHYNGVVWDNVRMNNIAQHFATAYFDKMIKGDQNMDTYLNLIPNSNDGVEETEWKGFNSGKAHGLKLEYLPKQ